MMELIQEIDIDTGKSRNYASRNNDKSHYYNRYFDDAVMELSIKQCCYYSKSRYNDDFIADWALS